MDELDEFSHDGAADAGVGVAFFGESLGECSADGVVSDGGLGAVP